MKIKNEYIKRKKEIALPIQQQNESVNLPTKKMKTNLNNYTKEIMHFFIIGSSQFHTKMLKIPVEILKLFYILQYIKVYYFKEYRFNIFSPPPKKTWIKEKKRRKKIKRKKIRWIKIYMNILIKKNQNLFFLMI